MTIKYWRDSIQENIVVYVCELKLAKRLANTGSARELVTALKVLAIPIE